MSDKILQQASLATTLHIFFTSISESVRLKATVGEGTLESEIIGQIQETETDFKQNRRETTTGDTLQQQNNKRHNVAKKAAGERERQ